jgi:chitodextrinase
VGIIAGSLVEAANGVSITGTGSTTGTGNDNEGVVIDGSATVVRSHSTGSATLKITGTGGGTGASQYSDGVVLSNSPKVGKAATSGATAAPVLIIGTKGNGASCAGIVLSGSNLGEAGFDQDITLRANDIYVTGTNNLTTTGKLTIEPLGTSFSGAWSYPFANLTVTSGITGLTIGKSGNTADLTIGTAQSIAGPIKIYGGAVNINQNIAATASGASVLLEAANGNVVIAASKSVSATNGDITLKTNGLSFAAGATITSTGGLYVQPYTNGTTIGIAGGAGTLSIPATHFSSVFSNTLSKIIIGNSSAGAITIGASLTPRSSTLGLVTAGNVGTSGAGALVVANLRVQAANVTLSGSNDIDNLAIVSSSSTVSFNDTDTYAAGTVDGVAGVYGVPSKLLMVTQPSSTASVGLKLAQQPSVKLKDAYNYDLASNNTTASGVSVSASDSTGGSLVNGTVTTNGNGVATFSNLALLGAPGSRTLTFSSSGLESVTSSAINLSKTNVTFAIVSGDATLTWSELVGATSYRVYVNGAQVVSGLTTGSHTLNTSAWKLDRLYSAQVRAVVDGSERNAYNAVLAYKPATGNVRMISSGWQHGLAVMADGTVREWGANDRNQLGAPVGLSDVIAISAGRFHNVALKADGTVVAWGRNGDSQTNVPNGLANVVAIAAGGYHSVAVKADGTVVAWGFNGNDIPTSTNVTVSTVPSEIATAGDVVDVAAGTFHTVVLKANGTVTGWGLNTSGQLTAPVGLSGVTELAANGNFSVALKADGTVVAWGANDWGQANVPASLMNVATANVVDIAAGGQHASALKSDGTLVSWGRGVEGQVSGTNGKTNVSDVASGSNYTMMLIGNSTVETTTSAQAVDTLIPVVLGGDLTAPTAPTNVILVSAKESGVEIGWMASTDNVAVTGYRIVVNGVVVRTVAGNVTNTTIFGLTVNTPITIRVSAVDARGNVSPLSNLLNVTLTDTTAPSAPSNLTATLVRPNGFLLSWTASTDNVAVTRYNVYRNGALVATVTGTSHRFYGLNDSTTYSVGVLALDAAGNRSTVASSNITTADGIAPTAPTSLTSAGVTKDRIMFQWSGATDNVGVVRYNIFLNGVYSKTVSATQSEFLSLASSTSYVVRVQAVDAAGNRSPLSSTLTLTTLDGIAPSVPSGLASSQITKTGFRVTWNASTDNGTVAKYNVYRNGTYVQTVTGTSYTFSGLAVNLTHNITVLAIDDAGNRSAQSTALSVATTFVADPTPPTAPTNLASSNVTNSGFRVTWTAATDNVAVTAYNIYRNGVYAGTVSGAGLANLRFTFSGLASGTTHSIVVRALDAEGNFTNSTALSVTTLP